MVQPSVVRSRPCGSFRKIGAPYFGVLKTLKQGSYYWGTILGPPIFGNSHVKGRFAFVASQHHSNTLSCPIYTRRHPTTNPTSLLHVGGCQNYGPFLGTLSIRCRIKIRTGSHRLRTQTLNNATLVAEFISPKKYTLSVL